MKSVEKGQRADGLGEVDSAALEEGQVESNGNSILDDLGDSMQIDPVLITEKKDDIEAVVLKLQSVESQSEVLDNAGLKAETPERKDSEMIDLDGHEEPQLETEQEQEPKEDLIAKQPDSSDEKEHLIQFNVGQTVACLVGGRYYLATIEEIFKDKVKLSLFVMV